MRGPFQQYKISSCTKNHPSWNGPSLAPHPVEVDNSTAVGFANNQIKQQNSKSMDMRYYWIQDRVAQKYFHVYWRPGLTNLGDYFTKNIPPSYHRSTRSTYLQSANHVASLRFCEGVLITSQDSERNGLIPPRDSSMSGLIHHNPSLGLRHDWARNLMSQHNSKPKEPCRSH